MKKFVAIFAVLTLAFAASAALAGNSMTLTDTDDSIFNQTRSVNRTFAVSHNAYTEIDSNLVIGANTGGNSLLAGDDVDAGSVNSGDATVIGTEQTDANGLDVAYTCACDGDGAEDNDVVADDTDDSIVNQDEEMNEVEAFDSQTYSSASQNTVVGANTGANTAAAGGDAGEDSPIAVDSGAGNVQFDRISVFNLVRITRSSL